MNYLKHQRRILEHRSITDSLFFPRRTPLQQQVTIECDDGTPLTCHYNQVTSAPFVFIFFHGNGEVAADYERVFPALFEMYGCSCLIAEYRGYGRSSGTPSLPHLLEDVTAVVNAANMPIERVIFYGRSLGCLPAIHAASLFPNAHAIILEAGRATLLSQLHVEWIASEQGIPPSEVREALDALCDHSRKLSSFKGLSYIVHSVFDRMVPISEAQQLYDWCNEPKWFEILRWGDHSTMFRDNMERYMKLFKEMVSDDANAAIIKRKAECPTKLQ
jgi:pimeloyl-ACP methyl ester carboxylesterase